MSSIRMLFLTILLVLVLDYSEGFVKGVTVKCENEGEYMDSAIFGPLRADSCIRCKCKNKRVVCSNPKCPTMEGCHVVMSERTADTCCDVCKGCTYKGVEYKHNETWTDPKDSCTNLECKAGVVTKSTMQCKTCPNPVKVPGMCCPVCPTANTIKGDCFIDGKLVRDGESASLTEDTCATCTCVSGKLSCSKPACPILNCPHSMIVNDPFNCCPYCEGSEKVFYPKNGACVFRGISYDSGKDFMPDKCTHCKCKDGSSLCERNACPVLDCVKGDQIHEKGSCCPSCKRDARKVNTCLKDERVVEHGFTWRQSPCTNCTCTRGKVICYSQQCKPVVECPNNQVLVQKMGECCQRCADAEAVCTISQAGSKTLAYKSFDDHHFKYDGVCKYLLTKDTEENTFVVRLQNGYFTPDVIGAKRVQIYVKVNSTAMLSVSIERGLVVKVNKTRVQLPYEVKDVFRVTKNNETVDFIMMSGLKIRYANDGHVQVIVSKIWEDRLSGLCGNFNGLSADDTTGRDGHVYGKEAAFASTWRIGGKCSCDRWMAPKDNTVCTGNVQERLKAHARCMVLKQDEFKKCRKLVKVDPYYRTCLDRVCRCKPSSINCECDVIVAYQKACETVGEIIKLSKTSACIKGTPTKSAKRETSEDKENKSTRNKKSGKTKSRKPKKAKKPKKEKRDKTSLKTSKASKVVQEIPSGDDDHIVELLEIKRKYQQALEKSGKEHVMTAEEVRSLAGVKVVKKPDPEEKKKKFDRGTLDLLFGR
ncbi:BMP-binding endothelial regulator protein-like [Lineus longissimus]|uniref:BMP-binding endothelial regulator protein-like n=1 Tax=Lineus longissimus TaxID=88925 RepID=UPI00315D90A8